MPEIEIICLANSRKMQGKCIAGLRTDGQGWVRPVAAGADGTLFPSHYTLPDGTTLRLLDIIRFGVSQPQPEPHQPENRCLDNSKWQLTTRPMPDTMRPLLRTAILIGPKLLGDTYAKISYDNFLATPAPSSLALILPQNLYWNITTNFSGKRQTKARFTLSGQLYDLPVSDAVWEHQIAHLPFGLHATTDITGNDRIVFTVSLSEPTTWDNCCYKLIATVLVIPQPSTP